jgi:hypothetical protein
VKEDCLAARVQMKKAKQWGGVHGFGVKREKEEIVFSLLKVNWKQMNHLGVVMSINTPFYQFTSLTFYYQPRPTFNIILLQ